MGLATAVVIDGCGKRLRSSFIFYMFIFFFFFFFFQAEYGIRDGTVTGVQTCALPIYAAGALLVAHYDPIALGLFQTPGEAGADIATADGQPLGVGLSFGGPYLGVFTCSEKYRSEERRVGKECRSRGSAEE